MSVFIDLLAEVQFELHTKTVWSKHYVAELHPNVGLHFRAVQKTLTKQLFIRFCLDVGWSCGDCQRMAHNPSIEVFLAVVQLGSIVSNSRADACALPAMNRAVGMSQVSAASNLVRKN